MKVETGRPQVRFAGLPGGAYGKRTDRAHTAMLLQVARTEAPRGFRLVGEVDISNADALLAALQDAIGEGGDVTLDLAGLAFMDSTGIQVIIKAARELEGRGRLRLVGPGALVRRTLERVQLGRMANVEIFDEESSPEQAE